MGERLRAMELSSYASRAKNNPFPPENKHVVREGERVASVRSSPARVLEVTKLRPNATPFENIKMFSKGAEGDACYDRGARSTFFFVCFGIVSECDGAPKSQKSSETRRFFLFFLFVFFASSFSSRTLPRPHLGVFFFIRGVAAVLLFPQNQFFGGGLKLPYHLKE